jgi:diguanylate cyclase (GGDEF)-like protein/PAS domain S-box-containing protein
VAREHEARNRLTDAIEAAPDGFVYYDKDDRLTLCNERYRELFPESADLIVPGKTFEEIVRQSVARGLFPAAEGREEEWIQQILQLHRHPGHPFEQEFANGRWVRVEERRTHDGGIVGFRTDITELKQRELALEKMAQREQEARNRLFDAIEAAPDGFVYFDSDDRLALCNSKYKEFFQDSADLLQPGTPFETIIRESVARDIFPDARGQEEEWIQKRLAAHRNPEGTFQQTFADGRWVRVEERRTRDGGLVGFRTDISELQERAFAMEQMAQREQEARNRLYDAIEAVPDGFVQYDAEDCLDICNERYREFYPESADLMIPGAPFEWIIRQGVARGQYVDAIGNEEAWIKRRLELHNNPQGPIEQQLPNGRWLRVEERRTRDGGLVGFRTDITELKQREFELERLATTDPLTGAMNRRSFLEAGEKELRRGLRYDVPLSVLLFDVDHFKHINDTYGHAAGDEVLRGLVKAAREELREHDLLCRYGGEEFSVVLPETDRAGAEIAAERLLIALRETSTPTEKGEVRATVSIGGTQVDIHNDSLESALSRADAALYEAKESGRNRLVFKVPARPRSFAAI